MTDIVINATAGGYIASSDAVYANARAGASLSATNAAADVDELGQRLDVGTYRVWQAFLAFDTSVLAGQTISAAKLSLNVSGASATSPDLLVVAYLRDWGGGTLTTADWVAGASLGGLTELGDLNAGTVTGGPAYFDLSNFGTALKDNLNTSGETRIMLASNDQADGNAPGAGGFADDRFLQIVGLVGGSIPATLTVTTAGSGLYPQTRMF